MKVGLLQRAGAGEVVLGPARLPEPRSASGREQGGVPIAGVLFQEFLGGADGRAEIASIEFGPGSTEGIGRPSEPQDGRHGEAAEEENKPSRPT
ncbi:MAG: hypothetical protein U0790_04260 [Isosphaeraceae bacterium]